MTTYDVGDLIRSTVTFTDFAGVNTDPSAVVFKSRTPAGVITTSTFPTNVTKSATGVYYSDVTITAEGSWWFRWSGTGTVIAATEVAVQVKASMFV